MKTATVDVEIKPHPRYPDTHRIAIVTTPRGLCYSATWAEPYPTTETVLKAWKEDRKAFDPYYG